MTQCEATEKSSKSRSHHPPSNRPDSQPNAGWIPRGPQKLYLAPHILGLAPRGPSHFQSLSHAAQVLPQLQIHTGGSHAVPHGHSVALGATLTAVSLTHGLSQSPSQSLTNGVALTLRAPLSHTHTHTHGVSLTLTSAPAHSASRTRSHPRASLSLTHTDTHTRTRARAHTASSSHAQSSTAGGPLTLKVPLTRTASPSGSLSSAASLTCPRPAPRRVPRTASRTPQWRQRRGEFRPQRTRPRPRFPSSARLVARYLVAAGSLQDALSRCPRLRSDHSSPAPATSPAAGSRQRAPRRDRETGSARGPRAAALPGPGEAGDGEVSCAQAPA